MNKLATTIGMALSASALSTFDFAMEYKDQILMNKPDSEELAQLLPCQYWYNNAYYDLTA
jgi:hypothetical protein